RIEGLRNRHFLILDAAALCVTPLIALVLRIEKLSALPPYLSDLFRYTVAALVLRIALFYSFGLYSRYWRYATVDELIQIAACNVVATAATTALYFEAMSAGILSSGSPRSLPILDGLIAMLIVGG